jgi:hypothetical protein
MIANGRYNKAVAVTPSDATDFVNMGLGRKLSDGLYIGGAGVVAVVFEDGTVVNFTAVAGQVLPVAARRVNSTNTTATLIVALIGL